MASGQIVEKKVKSLKVFKNNARTHDEKQIKQIAASIKEFGFNNPVLIDSKNIIIAGHGRVLAAKKLGLDTVPTITLKHLSDTQRRAYIIADNKIALNAGWDEDLLKLELKDLKALDFDIRLTGFNDGFLKESLNDTDFSDSVSEEFIVHIDCSNESEQNKLYEEMTERGLKCRVLSL